MTVATQPLEADAIRVLILAGGTGGHVYPALSVAEALRRAGQQVTWLGTERGLESRVAKQAGLPIHFVQMAGVRGKGLVELCLAPFRLLRALWQAVKVVRNVHPDVVLGLGGYVSAPGGLAAWLLRRPLVIHEQNAVPGMANRLLAPFAVRVLEAFEGCFPAARHAIHTGNPVRDEIVQIAAPEQRLRDRDGPLRLLILGGSQGAQVFNELVPRALNELIADARIEVRHQAGERHLEHACSHYREAGLSVRPVGFFADMAEVYAWADLVVCRAGAITVSELTAAGVASLLVPFPSATDDHQTRNARYLADRGAALLVQQSALSATRLAQLLTEFCNAREPLQRMAKAARKLAMPDATGRIIAQCMGAARG